MYVWILPSKNSKIYIYIHTYWVGLGPLPSNSHPQDDITCLGSGIPIDLHFATITGKVANPICINLNILMYIAKIYLLYICIYTYLKTIYVLQLAHIVYTIIKTSHDFPASAPANEKRPHLRRRDQTLLPYQRSQPLKIYRGVSHEKKNTLSMELFPVPLIGGRWYIYI